MKKEKQSPEILLKDLLSINVPKEYLEFFELEKVVSKNECWELEKIERPDLIPEALKNEGGVVLDGFCNPICVLTLSFSMKKIGNLKLANMAVHIPIFIPTVQKAVI